MRVLAAIEATQIACSFEHTRVRTPKRSRSPLEFPDVAKRQVQDRAHRVTDQNGAEPSARL
jgi:hypothetical protein